MLDDEGVGNDGERRVNRARQCIFAGVGFLLPAGEDSLMAYTEFIEKSGHFPNRHTYLFSQGILYLELRYHPGEEAMEEGDGAYYQLRVALDPNSERSNINEF